MQLRARLSIVSTRTARSVRHHLDPMISGVTDDQRHALRCIYERMRTHRRWPAFSLVDGDLDAAGLEAEAVLPALRPRYALFDPHFQPASDVALTAAGVVAIGGDQTSGDVTAFWALIQLGLRALREHEPDPDDPYARPQVSRRDAIAVTGIAEDVALRAFLIIQAEGIASGSSGPGADGDWTFSVGRDFRRWRKASDVHAFIAMRWAEREPVRPVKNAQPAGSGVFISFAARDRAIALRFHDLLRAGCNLTEEQVFVTARPDQLDPGTTFVEAIRASLRSTAVVVLLLTPAYYESRFCLAELGAAWALELPCIPLLVPPAAYADLEGVQLGVQALRVEHAPDLDVLRDRIASALGTQASTPEWNRQREGFLADWRTHLQSTVSLIAEPAPTRATGSAVASLAANGLELTIERIEWERFRNEALIANIRLRVANTTAGTKSIHAFQLRAVDGLVEHTDVASRIAALRATHPMPNSALLPNSDVAGWLAYPFVQKPSGGTPEFELVIEDEIRNRYLLSVPAGAPRTFSHDEPAV